jgi:hypothetical protein
LRHPDFTIILKYSAQKLPFDVLDFLPDGEAGCSTFYQEKVE